MNRLKGALSPYLLSHGSNPIDWYPWGEEAFQEAKRRDVPVMVSIGYHTCHWCHVMARESFEDSAVAALVNQQLVCIKVDREERPDVDSHYMLAAGAFTSQLGWPLNVFVTPDGDAFYAATYLPPTPRGGVPSFTDVVNAVTQAWRERRDEVEGSAKGVGESLRVALSHRAPSSQASLDWGQVVASLRHAEDQQYGGFAGQNKFPMAPVLDFLLDLSPREDAWSLATRTLAVMANSDLRDAIEGGFFRYATEPNWTIPHYERMLTDNALLLSCYSRAGMGDIAAGIVSFLKNVMAVPGGLASAQHSESVIDGAPVEGGYYLLDEDARAQVDPPELDRKVITGWVGMALSGLAHATQSGVAGAGQWGLELAGELLSLHRPRSGVLHRMSIDGEVSPVPAVLEDYGGLALGLLELGIAMGEPNLCSVGRQLVEECAEAGGGASLVSPTGGDPIIRRLSGGNTDTSEGATPSGEALIAKAALLVEALTGDSHYGDLARVTVSHGVPVVERNPLGAGGYASALVRAGSPHHVIVVVDDDVDGELRRVVGRVVSGSATVVCVTPNQAAAFVDAGFDLFVGRESSEPVAYVCRGTVCEKPDTTASDLTSHLTQLGLVSAAWEELA
jgi:uncharacterized protein